jgi:hypothetical protein
VRRSIREFLERKLRALETARAERTDGNDLPGRILFWPAPKNAVEANLHGVLEGLYVARKINDREASDWHGRFRSVLAVPGDPGTVVVSIGGPIPANVRARYEPWTEDTMIRAIDLDVGPSDYEGGSLSLTRAELHAAGISLHWSLDLSKGAQASVHRARDKFKKSSPDLVEFHVTRTLLPSLHTLTVSDLHNGVFEVLDMDTGFSDSDRIWAITRLTPLPVVPAELTVAWAARRFTFSVDAQSPTA